MKRGKRNHNEKILSTQVILRRPEAIGGGGVVMCHIGGLQMTPTRTSRTGGSTPDEVLVIDIRHKCIVTPDTMRCIVASENLRVFRHCGENGCPSDLAFTSLAKPIPSIQHSEALSKCHVVSANQR